MNRLSNRKLYLFPYRDKLNTNQTHPLPHICIHKQTAINLRGVMHLQLNAPLYVPITDLSIHGNVVRASYAAFLFLSELNVVHNGPAYSTDAQTNAGAKPFIVHEKNTCSVAKRRLNARTHSSLN